MEADTADKPEWAKRSRYEPIQNPPAIAITNEGADTQNSEQLMSVWASPQLSASHSQTHGIDEADLCSVCKHYAPQIKKYCCSGRKSVAIGGTTGYAMLKHTHM